MSYSRTKIVCTIGPAVNTLEGIKALIDAGMSVARLNFSHGTHEDHLRSMKILKQLREEMKIPLAIMMDTRGPEVNIGKIKGGQALLQAGQEWILLNESIEGDSHQVSVEPGKILDQLKEGTQVLFDDGYIISEVIKKEEGRVVVKILNGGTIKSQKGINCPSVNLDLPAVTENDDEDIRFCCKQGIDFIAASFIRSAEHVLMIKKILEEEGKGDIPIVSKIENHEGIENFDSIMRVSDGIMIARGDLGVEVPLSIVPRLQKMMIRKCSLAGKFTITATQMLESMIQYPRPTRAEVSDVANAIYDGTSLVMLSGETAVGKYPMETVKMMKSIVKESEEDFDYGRFFGMHSGEIYHHVPSVLTLAAVKTANSSNAKAIFAYTRTGGTAFLLARLRPKIPIIAMTTTEKCYHRLAACWGVTPFIGPECDNAADAFKLTSDFALQEGLLSYGDLVVVTAGSPFGIAGTTNTMIVESVGDVLTRGLKGYGDRVYGNVFIVFTPELIKPYSIRNQIIVITQCNPSYLSLIKEAMGIILQNQIDDYESEKYLIDIAKQLDKPVITHAEAAIENLRDGQLVTLNPEKALVYKGVVLS